MPKKEFTVNVDIQVFAKDESEAIWKVSSLLNNKKYKFWLGETEEYKEEN